MKGNIFGGCSYCIQVVFILVYLLNHLRSKESTVTILDTSLGNHIGPLLGSIWHINWCVPWLGAWEFLGNSNWVPYWVFSWIDTWHVNQHNDGTFTWNIYGQVSWDISRISYVLLFDSPLGDLFGSEFWYNVLKLIVDSPPQSIGRCPDLVVSPLQDTLVFHS